MKWLSAASHRHGIGTAVRGCTRSSTLKYLMFPQLFSSPHAKPHLSFLLLPFQTLSLVTQFQGAMLKMSPLKNVIQQKSSDAPGFWGAGDRH